MKLTSKLGMPAALAVAMIAAGVVPASADPVQVFASKTGSCKAGGDTLFGTVQYQTGVGGANVDQISFTIQDNGGSHNNAYLRLRGNGGNTTYWAWTSEDDLVGGHTYQFAPSEFVPRSSNPYVKFHVDFDQPGTDPSCQFYIHLY
jgi:hypothetical protein